MFRFGAILVMLFAAAPAFAQHIDRSGAAVVPSREDAQKICEKNPYIGSDLLLAACVKHEINAARSIAARLQTNAQAKDAYWTCLQNEYIDTHLSLNACMDNQMKALQSSPQ